MTYSMYTLGICAPYRRCEATLSAIRLADLGRELAMTVKFLAEGSVQKGVDHYWDKHVRSGKGDRPYRWAAGCTHIVWFSNEESIYQKAFLVSPGARHWHVPMCHSMEKSNCFSPQEGGRVVCTSKKIKDETLDRLYGEEAADPSIDRKITWCLWDSGFDAVSVAHMRKAGSLFIYVPVSSHVIDETGLMVLRAILDLLKLFPHVHFTVDCGKSWSKGAKRLIREMTTTYKTRMDFNYTLSPLSHVRRMHEHDWTWIPSTRVDTGIVAQRSLACGTPVIVYDINPYCEFITDEVNGLLVDCDIYSNWTGAPVAGPRFVSVVNTLAKAITGERELHSKCQRMTANREKQHSKQFRLFWAKEWDVV